jgi:hypothetical protein
MKLFAEKRIEELFSEKESSIKSYLAARRNDALTRNIETVANEIYELMEIQATLELDKKGTTVKTVMKSVPSNRMSHDVRMFATKNSYDLACVNYLIPFKGNGNLFNYQPRKNSNVTYEGTLRNSILLIELQTQSITEKLDEKTETEVTNVINQVVEKVEENINQVNTECKSFNETLKAKIIKAIEDYRKDDNERKEREGRLNPFK